MIEEHPWPTKILTSAALNAAGDFLGQTLFEKDKKFDWKRFAKFTFLVRNSSSNLVACKDAVYNVLNAPAYFSSACSLAHILGLFLQGGALVAPVLGIWYTVLSRAIPGTGVAAAVGKTVLDQGLFAPCFVSLFISSLLCLDGTPELIMSKLKQDLVPTVIANWSLWIPGQLLNFYFVPPSLTLLASNMIALIWCTYLSWAANKQVDTKYERVVGSGAQ
jgi:hypothetical protein